MVNKLDAFILYYVRTSNICIKTFIIRYSSVLGNEIVFSIFSVFFFENVELGANFQFYSFMAGLQKIS